MFPTVLVQKCNTRLKDAGIVHLCDCFILECTHSTAGLKTIQQNLSTCGGWTGKDASKQFLMCILIQGYFSKFFWTYFIFSVFFFCLCEISFKVAFVGGKLFDCLSFPKLYHLLGHWGLLFISSSELLDFGSVCLAFCCFQGGIVFYMFSLGKFPLVLLR